MPTSTQKNAESTGPADIRHVHIQNTLKHVLFFFISSSCVYKHVNFSGSPHEAKKAMRPVEHSSTSPSRPTAQQSRRHFCIRTQFQRRRHFCVSRFIICMCVWGRPCVCDVCAFFWRIALRPQAIFVVLVFGSGHGLELFFVSQVLNSHRHPESGQPPPDAG